MGFGKSNKDKATKKSGEFVPTTREEWKQISKRARKHDEARNERRASKKEDKNRRFPKGVDAVRDALLSNQPVEVRIYQTQFFDELIKCMKQNDTEPPSYHRFEELREVRDARFLFDMRSAMARMSWTQHARLISIAVNLPIPSRDWTEAWHMVSRLITQVFDVQMDRVGNQRIRETDALEAWPVKEKKRAIELSAEERAEKKQMPDRLRRAAALGKRKLKDKDTLDMFEEDEKRRLLAAKKEEDEEEDEVEEDEEEEDEDDDRDDEEDEKPKKKKGKKKVKDDEDDEEEDEEEDEEDEDEKPRKSKEKRLSSKKSKSDKSEKKAAKADKPEKKAAKKDSGGEGKYKVSKKFKGGIKESVQGLINASGSTLEQIVSAAKKQKLDKTEKKIKSYLGWLVSNGYCKKV